LEKLNIYEEPDELDSLDPAPYLQVWSELKFNGF